MLEIQFGKSSSGNYKRAVKMLSELGKTHFIEDGYPENCGRIGAGYVQNRQQPRLEVLY